MKKSSYKKVIGLLMLLILVMILLPTAAWFSFKSERDVNTGEINITAPYRLYLSDSKEKKTFSLSIGNLHPGQTLNVPFCVTNDPEGMNVTEEEKNLPKAEFQYQLELARTTNIPLTYTLFPAKKLDNDMVQIDGEPISGTDITGEQQVEAYGDSLASAYNKGIYTRFKTNDTHKMEITVNSNQYDYVYYILKVEFSAEISLKDYEKETDLIYLSGTVE